MIIQIVEDTQGGSTPQGATTLQGVRSMPFTQDPRQGAIRIQLAQCCELVEEVKRGTYSRLADEVRRKLDHVQHLTRITISGNAPSWRREACETVSQPKGLTTILSFDRVPFLEVHYKTATAGHRAKVFVKGALGK